MASASIQPTTDQLGPSLPASPGLRSRTGSRLPSRRGATLPSLDALPMAVLVVDGTGALHLANARARRLLFRGDGLHVERGYLTGATAGDTRRLQDAIGRAATAPQSDAPIEETLCLPSGARGAHRLRIRPGEPDDAPDAPLRRVWILVDDEDPRHAATLRLVAELTPRERDVLRHLVAGDGAKEIAWSLGLSAHTVAGYVKALHRRLGVRSRGELLARFIGPGVAEALAAEPSKPAREAHDAPPASGVGDAPSH